jgi:hypothetical protein
MKLKKNNAIIMVFVILFFTSCANIIRPKNFNWNHDIGKNFLQKIVIKNDTIFIAYQDTIKMKIDEYTGAVSDTSFYNVNMDSIDYSSGFTGVTNRIYVQYAEIKNSDIHNSIVRYELIVKSPRIRGGKTKYKLAILYKDGKRSIYRFSSKFEYIEKIIPYRENKLLIRWDKRRFCTADVIFYVSLIEFAELQPTNE